VALPHAPGSGSATTATQSLTGTDLNLLAILILAALLIEYVIGLVASTLNLRRMGTDVPDAFRDVYEADAYARSQQYTRDKTRLSRIESGISLAALVLFWFAGGFPIVDEWARSFGWGSIPTGLLFIGILGGLASLLSLPFDSYATFVLEARYGFNRTDLRTFVLDRLKGLLLTVGLGAPLFAAVLWFFETAGPWAWLLSWLMVVLVTALVQWVAPRWLMPLFYKFAPLEDGALRTALLDYAESVKFSLSQVFVIDGSRRSSKANAFFTGFGRNRRVALYDTLIARHSTPELVAVVAHEVGHFKLRHIVKGLVLSILHTGLLFFLLSLVLESRLLFDAFYLDEMSVYAGFVLFSILYSPVDFVLGLGLQALSRRHEFEADAFAARTTGSPEHLVEALKKLSVDHLDNLTPHPLQVALHYSHPPVMQRIEALGKQKSTLSSS
jgi:STE24 endopeptidase